MNEADPSPINLDELRLLPDWLREEGPPPSKQYAGHQGGEDDYGARRGPRPGGSDRGRDSRGFSGGGPRRDGGRRPGAPAPRGGNGGGGRPMRDDWRPEVTAVVLPAPVRIEFLPDDKCLASIVKQIRSTHMAYPLFGLARMFLQEPARHWVQFSLVPGMGPADATLYQLDENGPVTLDRAVLERMAFDASKDRYYAEQTEQKDPPKGNYTNVARNRLNGALLGPTNYHGYQPALRSDYEKGFSRRMSFEDYRRNIEVVNDPALVERWKEEARTTTSIITREGEPPTALASLAEAKVHFRQHYLDQLLRTGTTFKAHGSVARNLPEPAMMQAIRQAHDTELRYPAQFVQLLRQGLQNAGLHIFKHRKRVVYVSLARPTPFAADGAVSENVAAILETVAQFPLCTRKVLAERVLARKFKPQVQTAETEAAPKESPAAGPTVATSGIPAASELSTTDNLSEDRPVDPEAPTSSHAGQVFESVAAAPDAASGNESATLQSDEVIDPAPKDATANGTLAAEPVAAAIEPAAASDDPLARAKATLAADLRFLVQSGHLIEFHNGTFDLPLPPKPKEEPRAVTRPPRSNGGKPENHDLVPRGSDTNETDGADAERDALTVESVTILTPGEPADPTSPSAIESGLEKTEAQIISGAGSLDDLGSSPTDQPPVSSDRVVIGDSEAAHPLSPL